MKKTKIVQFAFLFILSSVIFTVIEELLIYCFYEEWITRNTLIYGIINPFYGLTFCSVFYLNQIIKSKQYWVIISFAVNILLYYIYSLFINYDLESTININFLIISGGVLFIIMCLAVSKIKASYLELFLNDGLQKFIFIGVILVVFDMLLTTAAMARYFERIVEEIPSNIIETIIDKAYSNEYLENQFPKLRQ